MKHIITTTTLISAMAFSGAAFASSMDADLQALCQKDSDNTAQGCSCTVDLVKSSMEPKSYAVLHALATTDDNSEERNTKLAALSATPEDMQGVGEKFQSLVGDIKAKCNVTIENSDGEGEG